MTITFLNQPKLSEHEVDAQANERRTALVQEIELYVSGREIFQYANVEISFFHTGVASLVCLLVVADKKYVLKIALSATGSKGEALFLEAWEKAGVSVPHIFETGNIGEHSYILMVYIEAQTLEHAFTEEELVDKNIFYRMGQILKLIHTVSAEGYGRIMDDGMPECADFKSWLCEHKQHRNQLEYTQKHNLLLEEIYGSVENAKDFLVKYVAEHPQSVYCHWDFALGNILNADKLTVFDPVPMVNISYLDLAKAIIQNFAHFYNPEIAKQLIGGYVYDGGQVDIKILQAAVLFVAHTKFPYWHKTNEIKKMENVRKYLKENSILLF